MKNAILAITILVLFTSCHSVQNVLGNEKFIGNGYFIYTYADNNLRPPDTFAINGLVTNIKSYEKIKFQDYFTVQRVDSVNNVTLNKEIKTENIVYAKIKSIYGKDSVEYVNQGGDTWRVVRQRDNLALLDRSYYVTETHYLLDDIGTSTRKESELILVKNGKKIKNMHFSFKKGQLVNFINKNYGQRFTEKDFEHIDEMLDYILDKESENTTVVIKPFVVNAL